MKKKVIVVGPAYIRINVFYEELIQDSWNDRFVCINLDTAKYTHDEIEKEINRVLTIICGEGLFKISNFFLKTNE